MPTLPEISPLLASTVRGIIRAWHSCCTAECASQSFPVPLAPFSRGGLMVTSHLRSGGRYPVLRSLGILYLIFGAVFAVAGIIAAVYFILRGPGNWTDRFFEMCAALAATAFAVLTMLAI